MTFLTENNHDNLFAKPLGKIENFSFDKAVVDVFPDMIRRSVPGYETILAHCGELAARYVQAESTCYDLGCSLGATSLAMRSRINAKNAKIVSIDNSQAMLSKLSKILESIPSKIQTELVNQDVCECTITNRLDGSSELYPSICSKKQKTSSHRKNLQWPQPGRLSCYI